MLSPSFKAKALGALERKNSAWLIVPPIFRMLSFNSSRFLTNPSLLPAINFRKYNLPEEYYDDYEFLQDLTKDFTRRNIVAFVGENDDVVPVTAVVEFIINDEV